MNQPREAARTLSWRGIADTAALPDVGRLVSIGFFAVLAFAAIRGHFRAFPADVACTGKPQTAAYAFAGLGFFSAIVQGGLIRRLVPRFGEARLIVVGLDPGRLRFRRSGACLQRSRADRCPLRFWPRARDLQPERFGSDLANHSDERTGGRLRNAHLGTDSRPDDQLLGGQFPARQSLDRGAVLGGLRRRSSIAAGGRGSPGRAGPPSRTCSRDRSHRRPS